MSKRKFFSGNSLRQALVSAASHFDVPVDEIAYREVEKRHGFLKVRKRAVIEVDAEDPRRSPRPMSRGEEEAAVAAAGAEPEPQEAAEAPAPRRSRERAAPEAGPEAGPEPDVQPAASREPEAPEKHETGGAEGGEEDEEDDLDGEDGEEDEDGDEDDEGEDEEPSDDDRARPVWGRRDPEVEAQEQLREARRRAERPEDDEAAPAAPQQERTAEQGAPVAEEAEGPRPRGRRRRRRGGRGGSRAEGGETASGEGLVELPERPRRPAERYAEATGELADATRDALDHVLDVAGVDVSYTVLQGDDRFEIELAGPGEALLLAEGGELLRAIELLVPRVVRGVAGESVNVRVDCGDFHEIHEEQLRSLAQRTADEVRRSERPRTLEPMSPADRRIIHLTLADEPRVTSMSEGSGYFKRIVVKPT